MNFLIILKKFIFGYSKDLTIFIDFKANVNLVFIFFIYYFFSVFNVETLGVSFIIYLNHQIFKFLFLYLIQSVLGAKHMNFNFYNSQLIKALKGDLFFLLFRNFVES